MEESKDFEDIDLKEVEKEEVRAKEILEKLAILIEKQAINAKLRTAINVREAKNKITEKVNALKDGIISAGKRFGVSADKIRKDYLDEKEARADILKDYKDGLNKIAEVYEARTQECEEKIGKLEAKEQELAVKLSQLRVQRARGRQTPEYKRWISDTDRVTKRLNKDLKAEDRPLVEQWIEDLKEHEERNPLKDIESEIERVKMEIAAVQEEIVSAQHEYGSLQSERQIELDNLLELRNNRVDLLPKQGPIKTFLGAFFNKINGSKKFADSVIKNVKESIDVAINDKVPVIVEKAATTRDKAVTKTKTNIRERIDKIKEFKLNILKAARDKLDMAIERESARNAELNNRNNPNNPNRDDNEEMEIS